MPSSFRGYESARDGAAALIGLGGASFAFSLGYLIYCWFGGFGFIGWLTWYLGPATFLLAMLLLPLGLRLGRRAARLRRGLR